MKFKRKTVYLNSEENKSVKRLLAEMDISFSELAKKLLRSEAEKMGVEWREK